tara:strand:+ start:200 stop:361 length:162 start_codon:yes stop_codon:yes gene_type:complete
MIPQQQPVRQDSFKPTVVLNICCKAAISDQATSWILRCTVRFGFKNTSYRNQL